MGRGTRRVLRYPDARLVRTTTLDAALERTAAEAAGEDAQAVNTQGWPNFGPT